MVGFPAELSWLKGNEEVGRRDMGCRGDDRGVLVGVFQGDVVGVGWAGVFILIFLGQQRQRGICLSWQTHLAGNCPDQTDSQSRRCMDKQRFTTPIGKVNRSHIRPVHKQC